jgi:hypothetical protein
MVSPSRNDALFVFVAWLASRLLVLAAMLLLAPALPVPANGHAAIAGWDVFRHWDGTYYESIAVRGYEYRPDGQHHNVVFFPLFPLLAALVSKITGLAFTPAAVALNGAAFLGALFVVYGWVERWHGRAAARWTVALMCACPLSLFDTVAYSESLFLLFSGAALRAFDRERYVAAGCFAACASATRFLGAAFVPAFALAAYARRVPRAYASAALAAGGLLAFALYCGIAFGDPSLFFSAQAAWRHGLGFQPDQWSAVLVPALSGWNALYQAGIAACAVALARTGKRIHPAAATVAALLLVIAEAEILTPNDFARLILIGGGTYALVRYRARLGVAPVAYGAASLVVIFSSGILVSIERVAFDVVPLVVALGLLCTEAKAFGRALILFWIGELAVAAIAFAQWLWVA